jgi:hypothetical protein
MVKIVLLNAAVFWFFYSLAGGAYAADAKAAAAVKSGHRAFCAARLIGS